MAPSGTTGTPAPQAAYPAVYRAIIDTRTHVARLHAVFSDEARATVANPSGATRGQRVRLGLTDPDSNETVPVVTGPFQRGSEIVATTPCDESTAPSTCPGPGFSANYLGEVNPQSGAIAPLALRGAALVPQGLLFLP